MSVSSKKWGIAYIAVGVISLATAVYCVVSAVKGLNMQASAETAEQAAQIGKEYMLNTALFGINALLGNKALFKGIEQVKEGI